MEESTESIQLRAPAKINLSFRLLHRRDDGFHEIETLMKPVSLFDVITITRAPGDSGIHFSCDDATLPTGDDNLVVRAARSFLSAAHIGAGLRIHLQKNIPHGAGLGGGSSDAATVMLGLSQLFQKTLTHEALVGLAAEIGSDVPFFLFESAAVCRGRGELVTPTRLWRQLPLLLLKPGFGVPTPSAYAGWAASKELPHVRYSEQDLAEFKFVNDLERPVFEKHLFLAHSKMWLLEQPEVAAALMSGSGSTLFAVLRDFSSAEALAERAHVGLDPSLWVFPCHTM